MVCVGRQMKKNLLILCCVSGSLWASSAPFQVDNMSRQLANLTQQQGLAADVYQSEANRLLYDALSLSTDTFIDHGRSNQAFFFSWLNDARSMPLDVPWTEYKSAFLHPENLYKIRGNIGDAVYLVLQVYSQQGGKNTATLNLSSKNLSLDDNGNFEFTLGPKGQYMLNQNDFMIVAKVYYQGASILNQNKAQLSINEVKMPNRQPFIEQNKRLEFAERFFSSMMEQALSISQGASSTINTFRSLETDKAFSAPFLPSIGISTQVMYVDLTDQTSALKIEADLPTQYDYAFFSFYSPFLTTADYKTKPTFLTNYQLDTSNGHYNLYLGKESLNQRQNYLSTGGMSKGILVARFLNPDRNFHFHAKVTPIKSSQIPHEAVFNE